MNQYRVNNYSILSSSATSSLFVSSGSVSLRKKKVSRPTWKTLSLSRKNKLKEEESGPAAGDLFKSPSIYGNRDNIGGGEAPSVMSSYLSGKPKIRRFNTQTTVSNLFQVFQWDFFFSGKICPLTPSQQQTDISHLVQRELKEKLKSPDYPQQQQRQTFRDDEDDDDEYNTNKQNALVPANVFQSHSKSDGGGGICTVM